MKICGLSLCLCALACSSLETVRLQPETVDVGPGLRPVAGVQASAHTMYLLFIPIPGDVSLDRVVNRMLVVTAKTMGADKVAQLRFEVDAEGDIGPFWRILGWRGAKASGIAVQVVAPPADPAADQGPEGPVSVPVPAPVPAPSRGNL